MPIIIYAIISMLLTELDLQIKMLLTKLKDHAIEDDFRRLYDLLYDRFFRIAIYYLKKEEWAQEVVLDVFFSLWNKRKELAGVKNFDGYCFILIKKAALNYLSKADRHTTDTFDNETIINKVEASPEDNLLNDELLLVYVQALDDLPPRCREVFILIREQGLSYMQVAEKLNISTKTVDAQLQKALQRLKEKIKEYFS